MSTVPKEANVQSDSRKERLTSQSQNTSPKHDRSPFTRRTKTIPRTQKILVGAHRRHEPEFGAGAGEDPCAKVKDLTTALSNRLQTKDTSPR